MYRAGDEITFRDNVRDIRSDADVTVRHVVVNGEIISHDGATYVPVYVRDGDRCIIVHESNILENVDGL